MEDRYELRGKIGQGGLGAVYRAYDTRMSRIVAIKRITPSASDSEHVEESTKQLVKEAGALAKLQHPNIVTIHDVGSDTDGPFVVMELIEGKTLDEAIDHAPLTWQDFRELAMQVMEALIAAQEHNLIHSDLKPANLMVTWLPSGKFQIKIVDFGLASLSLSQKKEDLKSVDVVYGSIFFMPPEQFERQPLDLRSDMYSIGCVFYQALAGRYPFGGETTQEVMTAHLNHTVAPLKEVRAGIPMWVSDWVMWHLNRDPKDRPESARAALSNFLQNDKFQGHPLTTGKPAPTAGPPRRKMRLPGETSSHEPLPIETSTNGPSAPEPQPLRPPEGLKPSIHTSTVEVVTSPQQLPTSRVSAGRSPAAAASPGTQRVGLPHAAKSKKNIVLIASACVSLLTVTGLVMMLNSSHAGKRLAADLLTQVETHGGREFPVNQESLDSLLGFLTTPAGTELAPRLCPALVKVKATDTTNVDLKIAEVVANNPKLPLRTRDLLIVETLIPRANPASLPVLLKIAESAKEKELVASALLAIRPMITDEHFGPMVKIFKEHDDSNIRSSAETNLAEVLRKSKNPSPLVDQLRIARGTSVSPDEIQAFKRLLSMGDALGPALAASKPQPTPPPVDSPPRQSSGLGWTPELIQSPNATVDFDINSSLTSAGVWAVTFTWTKGSKGLLASDVQILVNGKVVAEDRHQGLAGIPNSNNIWHFEIPSLATGAKVQLRAKLAGNRGTDSFGEITLKRLGNVGEVKLPGTAKPSLAAPRLSDRTVVVSGTAASGTQAQDFPLPSPASGRYLALETLSSKTNRQFVHLAELIALGPDKNPLPSGAWKVLWTDSEETQMEDGRAARMIDGDTKTFWHSRYGSAVTDHPHVVVIDLGSQQKISAIRLIQRNAAIGNVEAFRIHVSNQQFPKP